jgi:alkylation response protein AidB-like acyl-CoA dehydrogenase
MGIHCATDRQRDLVAAAGGPADTFSTRAAGHDGPRLLLCRIALDQVTIHQTWDTMGMRATQSNDLELDGVFVADVDVVHSLPVGHLDARVFETVWAAGCSNLRCSKGFPGARW